MDFDFTAWAIDSRSTEGHGFIGRYWWFGDHAPVIPVHLEGCQPALFTTRKIARENLRFVRKRYGFPKARVVRVSVSVRAT